MKILIITEYFPSSEKCEVRGGVETRTFYLTRELAKRHEVYVICSKEKDLPDRQEISGINVIRCGPQKTYSQKSSFFKRFRFLLASIREGKRLKVDIVEGNFFICYLAAWSVSKKLKTPRVITYHDVWLGEWKKNLGFFSGILGELLERYVLKKKWDKIIAVSNSTREKLIKAKIEPETIEIVYNGIDLEALKRVISEKDQTPTIICLSRLVTYKRIDVLLYALRTVREKIPEVKLIIIGTGPEEKRLKNIAKKIGISENVIFMGYIESHREVLETVKSGHIFCLPSEVEGFGIATIEALALGIPFVNADIAPNREILNFGRAGLLFEPGNSSDLAKELLRLFEDKELYEDLKKESSKTLDHFLWLEQSRNLENIYKSLI